MPGTNLKQIPISEFQKRFFLEWTLAPLDNTYTVSFVNRIYGNLDVNLFKQACEIFIKRNEVIHSQYSEDGQSCYYGDFTIYDFFDESVLNIGQSIEFRIREILSTPFKVGGGVLMKFYLIRSNSSIQPEYYFVFVAQHILFDLIAARQMCSEISDAYGQLKSGNTLSLEVHKCFTDAVECEKRLLTDTYNANAQQYWIDFIGDIPLKINLPKLPESSMPDKDGIEQDKTAGFIHFDLNPYYSVKLRKLAREKHTTVFILLSAIWGFVLSKYSNQKKILLSYPYNTRSRGFEHVTGCFVNNLPLKLEFDNVNSLDEVINLLGVQRKEGRKYLGYSYTNIILDQRKIRNEGVDLFFNVCFGQTQLSTLQIKLLDAEVFPVDINISDKSFYDVCLLYDEDVADNIKFKFEYRVALYGKESVSRIISSFRELLSSYINNKNIFVSNYSILDAEEYHKIVYEWNVTDKAYPFDKTINKVFETQAELTPDTIALVYEGQQLTYNQLNEWSNQLARHIRRQYEHKEKRPLAADTLIGLYLERGLEMVTGILAILKAGGAYLPIDTNYPQERIDYMLEDSRAELILSQSELMQGNSIQLPEDKVIFIDNPKASYSKESSANLSIQSKSGSLAYVIYTSGTTGRPKGVMVEHRSVLSLVFNDYIDLSPDSVFAFLSSPVFDATTFELWTPLLKGLRLIIPADVRNLVSDISRFRRFISINGVSVMWLTKTLFESLYYADNEVFSRLEYLLIGGEALDRNTVNKMVTSPSKPKHLLNGYGPTEGTTFTCTFELKAPVTTVNIPIGSPINNRRVYVLDRDMIPVPTGVSGELYIGGAGIARGYLNQPELTVDRFIPNPFATEADQAKGYTRLYKTGDMVSWLTDGNLEFIGRNDDQVKIRGYRIELGEIEHAFSRIGGIKQNCVLVKERKTETGIEKYLVGYYVQDSSWQSSNDAEILEGWEDLYDTEYEKAVSDDKVETDFTGWNSYITGRPIPIPEMLLWQQSITDIIKSLNPGRILEVGVGSGLLMYPLLEEVQSYACLDLSQSVIRRHKERLRDKEKKISFYHLKADQIEELPIGEYYDTIIINSVCQYFPGMGYFEEMLEQALAKLSAGGSVFLGDIRNYEGHKELIRERFAYKGESCSQREIDQIALKENELLISPEYFRKLTKRNEKIEVTILPRTGRYVNELSKYRYDVLIRVNEDGQIINNRFVIDEAPGGDSKWKTGNDHNIPYLNQLSKEEIIRQLSEKLPSYMVPATIGPKAQKSVNKLTLFSGSHF
jgi:amino acid adenylation domain-containing protein